MSRDTLEQMTDRELLDECRYRNWERGLTETPGCLLALTAGFVPICGLAALTSGFLWGLYCFVFVGPILSLVVLLNMVSLAGARSRPYLRELRNRCGQGELEFYIRHAEERLRTPGAPDWIVIVQTFSMPHGESTFTEISIWETDGPQGLLRSVRGLPLKQGEGTMPETTTVESKLSPEECRSLCDVLRLVPNNRLRDVPAGIKDGCGCAVAVVGKLLRAPQIGRCNAFDAWKPGWNLPMEALPSDSDMVASHLTEILVGKLFPLTRRDSAPPALDIRAEEEQP